MFEIGNFLVAVALALTMFYVITDDGDWQRLSAFAVRPRTASTPAALGSPGAWGAVRQGGAVGKRVMTQSSQRIAVGCPSMKTLRTTSTPSDVGFAWRRAQVSPPPVVPSQPRSSAADAQPT
jgi:hypothetical protein